jgi:hypothetical protein
MELPVDLTPHRPNWVARPTRSPTQNTTAVVALSTTHSVWHGRQASCSRLLRLLRRAILAKVATVEILAPSSGFHAVSNHHGERSNGDVFSTVEDEYRRAVVTIASDGESRNGHETKLPEGFGLK